jgi:hypothetical protein
MEATRSQIDMPSIIRWYEKDRFFFDQRTSDTMKLDPHMERKAVMRGANWKKVSCRVMVIVLGEGSSGNQPTWEIVLCSRINQSTNVPDVL